LTAVLDKRWGGVGGEEEEGLVAATVAARRRRRVCWRVWRQGGHWARRRRAIYIKLRLKHLLKATYF
jgi:hypothetical protein